MDSLLTADASIKVLYEPAQPATLNNIKVAFSKKFNRKSFEKLDSSIEQTWKEQTFKNPRWYNATKFRLESVTTDNSSNIQINLGLTDYKEMICTNKHTNLQEVYDYGIQHHNNKQACLSDALGVGCIVTTIDNYVVLIRRSLWVGEAQGLVDTPGGHAEPDEILKKQDIEDIFTADNHDIRYELFHSMVREVRDELNVPEEELSFPKLLAVLRNECLGGKPCMTYILNCRMNKNEILKLYNKGGPETDESTELIFWSNKDIISAKSSLMEVLKNMAPCGRGAIVLYHKYLVKQMQP